MNTAKSIHDIAMEYALRADVVKAKDLPLIEEKKSYLIAYLLEVNAVSMLDKSKEIELTKFIWTRSAAALAYKAGLYEESLKIIRDCLATNPPEWIADQLIEIKEGVKEEQYTTKEALQLEGIVTDINTREYQVILKDEANKKEFSIIIPPNLLKTIVHDYWTKKVQIQAKVTDAGLIILEQIRQVA